MEKLIITSLIISLYTIGLFVACCRGMIFHKPAKFLAQKLPIWIHKPLFSCSVCMSSVHGCLFWILFHPFEILYLPVVILMVAGINTIITAIISPIMPDENEE